MKYLDLTLDTPAENLACDEALLDLCEEERVEILRFWESRQHFVVVGYGNQIEREVNIEACHARGIPILRRCTGGGTVLQGPGCLNYALVMRIPESGPLTTVTATNQFVMERNRAAMEKLLGFAVSVQGHTDLAVAQCKSARADLKSDHDPLSLSPQRGEGRGEGWMRPRTLETRTSLEITTPHPHSLSPLGGEGGPVQSGGKNQWLKFSGNAQRRKRASVLFHGTFLCGFDLTLVEDFLRMPSKHPEYRDNRAHLGFLTNLQSSRDSIHHALRSAWNAFDTFGAFSDAAIAGLVQEKYGNSEWTARLR